MVILLSVIYYTMVMFVAIPFKILADPLAIRRPGRPSWTVRGHTPEVLDSMRRQG